ncbi:MAG: DUF4965 domain-containing protein [Ruminococcaceae bacterium]|nr:DUF4965 domain-containing protein [Oscillospiraceae bacterium]
MQLRAPAYPLITIDPYFSVWSQADRLTDAPTVHWTNQPNTICGTVTVDGKPYRIIGNLHADSIPAMKQTRVDCSAFSTTYVFEEGGVRLTLLFTSPLLLTDLHLLTRPVSYLEIKRESIDGKRHSVSVKIAVSEEICMNRRGDDEVDCEILSEGALSMAKMGRRHQRVLERHGDDHRIEWGYFYLTSKGEGSVYEDSDMTFVATEVDVKNSELITFAYDDLYCLEYFHAKLKTVWNKDGASITDEIACAHADYKATMKRCAALADAMFSDAVRAGGEKYAELLELAYRQTIAAHKVALDENGEVLFVSKECFSNGCAATVDVSYPSIPLFLLYNPELVKGMMRPIYRYALSDEWTKTYGYDFAPHDAGRYPILNGQMYGCPGHVRQDGVRLLYEKQMPVEECGNMLIMEAAVAVATQDASFAKEHLDTLETWVQYLIDNGRDPANQLCTDDFAGHLAHNCNLSLKAIMGIASLAILYGMLGRRADQKKYLKLARSMAADWAKRAANDDGSYRLAFDVEGSFSMKYNMVWDKLFGLDIMPRGVMETEFASYRKRMDPYGMPLDNRQHYTKSDWTAWTATLAERREDFEAFIAPMWNAFHYSPSRVPMTDWYWTVTSEHKAYVSRTYVTGEENAPSEKSFRNRTVQGGLYIKLLEYRGILNLKK